MADCNVLSEAKMKLGYFISHFYVALYNRKHICYQTGCTERIFKTKVQAYLCRLHFFAKITDIRSVGL